MTCSRGNLSGGLAFIVCGLIASASPAISADLAEPPHEQLAEPVSPPSDWQFNFTPYGWLTSVNGDVTVRGRTLDVDASFIDIVQESDSLAALMGHFEARKGRLSLYGDFVWDKLTFSADTLTLRNPIANLSLTTSASAGVDYRQSIFEGGVAYEIARLPGYGGSAKDPYDGATSFTAVDLLAGARYWRQEVDLSLAITGVVDLPSIGFTRSGDLAVARSGSMEWVDPVIGMRVRRQFSPGQEMLLRGDIRWLRCRKRFLLATVWRLRISVTDQRLPCPRRRWLSCSFRRLQRERSIWRKRDRYSAIRSRDRHQF